MIEERFSLAPELLFDGSEIAPGVRMTYSSDRGRTVMTMHAIQHIKKLVAPILSAFIALAALPGAMAGAAEIRVNLPSGGVAIFVLPAADPALGALGIESAAALRDAFDRCGRFLPIEEHQLRWAYRGAQGVQDDEFYERAARLLDVDLYVVVSFSRMGEAYGASMRVVPRREELRKLDLTARLGAGCWRTSPLNSPERRSRCTGDFR